MCRNIYSLCSKKISFIIILKEKYTEHEENCMRKGVLKFFNLKKGFGFIEDEETGEQYFVRYRSFLPNKIRMTPAANSRVSFDIVQNNNETELPLAVNVTFL